MWCASHGCGARVTFVELPRCSLNIRAVRTALFSYVNIRRKHELEHHVPVWYALKFQFEPIKSNQVKLPCMVSPWYALKFLSEPIKSNQVKLPCMVYLLWYLLLYVSLLASSRCRPITQLYAIVTPRADSHRDTLHTHLSLCSAPPLPPHPAPLLFARTQFPPTAFGRGDLA